MGGPEPPLSGGSVVTQGEAVIVSGGIALAVVNEGSSRDPLSSSGKGRRWEGDFGSDLGRAK